MVSILHKDNVSIKPPTGQVARTEWYSHAMEQLIEVVQDLSHARDLETIIGIVRVAARKLTGADGATFVLRDGDHCFYAEENAIAPLWKGRRFPMPICISGWVMQHAEAAVIEDIYADSRIPADAYRPTFVKSLAMVPIRRNNPIAAIGNYWATKRMPTPEEVSVLQALADTTSVAMENVELFGKLQGKIRELQRTNHELSRFAWVASHDLKEPLRTITTQIELLDRRYGDKLDERGKDYIRAATESAARQQKLIEDLLVHARVERPPEFHDFSADDLVAEVLADMKAIIDESKAQITCEALPTIYGSGAMLSRVFQNLISNGIKFHKRNQAPEIKISCVRNADRWLFAVEDNGVGIDEVYLQSIFEMFQRLNAQSVYQGSGIGLATCKKIVELHNGKIWAESTPAKGSCFYFTIPAIQNRN